MDLFFIGAGVSLAVSFALAVAALRRWHENGDRAAFWLGLSFGMLCLGSASSVTELLLEQGDAHDVLLRVRTALTPLLPLFLFRFAAALEPPPAWLRLGVDAVSVALVAAALAFLAPAAQQDDPANRALVLLLVGQFLLLSLFVIVRLWRAGASEPELTRLRVRQMSVGVAALLTAVLLMPVGGNDAIPLVKVLLVVAAELTFFFGFLPPAVVRDTWRRNDIARLRVAMLGLVSAADAEEVVAAVLPHLDCIAGGRGAALIDDEGRVLGVHGIGMEEARELAEGLVRDGAALEGHGAIVRGATLHVPIRVGWLLVRIGPYTPLFGRDETELVESVAAMTELALQRVDHHAQERATGERLQALDSIKNDFIAMIAHELRSPITVIGGFARTMHDAWDQLDESQKLEYLDLIARNADGLEHLVVDMLQVARLESEDFSVERVSFDVREIVDEVVREIRTDHPDARVEVIDERGDEHTGAEGDPDRQRQVLRNLLSNAVKYSEAPAWVQISLRRDARAVSVTVRDHGRGIAIEDQGRLFGKFSRVQRDEGADAVPGTGLGLYITRKLVEAQGGSISVDSRPGRGAAFTYTTPAAHPPEEPGTRTPPRPGHASADDKAAPA